MAARRARKIGLGSSCATLSSYFSRLGGRDKGKFLYKVMYTVSADGKTLTETGTATATKEKVKVVYDRQ
jgi:hypothetical protein